VKAAKTGFLNFASNFLEHLKAGLIDWLTGSLPGVYIPKSFTLGELVKFVFSVLGISWANVRQKLVKVVGETAVKAMETGFDIVVTLVTQGPAAAWEKIKEALGNLKDMVIGGITDFVVDTVVKKAIPKLVAMFIPGAGFISAIISIYDTVMVFVQKISKIIQVVTAFIDSIVAIAAGAIGAAAARVEKILAGLLSLAISFLAGFVGLGKVADKVMGVINKVRAPIDKALDSLINWIVTMAKKLFAKVFGKKDERTDAQKKADLQKAIQEATKLQGDLKLSDDELKRGLASIKKQYKLVSLDLIVDSEDESKEVIHVEGKVNPPDATPRVTKPKDGKTAAFILGRPSFTMETLEKLEELYPEAHKQTSGDRPLVKKGMARRHIVSSKDIAEHYETTLKGLLWSKAAALLSTKGKGDALVTAETPLANKTIHGAAKTRHGKFFNSVKNLFLGDRFRNSEIGRSLDKEKPGMGEVKLKKHIADVKRTWALGPFEPTDD
jgi:hypothetical protein